MVNELKKRLLTRYSLMVEFTEPTGMIVIPTRFDRVITVYSLVFCKERPILGDHQKLISVKSGGFHEIRQILCGFHVDFMKSGGFHADFMQISCGFHEIHLKTL